MDKSVKLALIAYIEYLILIESTGIVYLKHLGKNENCMQSFWISITADHGSTAKTVFRILKFDVVV